MAKKKTKKQPKRRNPGRPRRQAPRRTRRRRNPGGSVPWKDILIAGAAGIAALYAGTKVSETETFSEFTEGDGQKQALVQVGVGVLGAAGVYYLTKSAPAALGVAAGLAGFAGYAYLNSEKSGESSVSVKAEGTTAGLGYSRARAALGCASSTAAAGCQSACPVPDDMAEIRDDDCDVPDDISTSDLC